jgi:hypothetical protein
VLEIAGHQVVGLGGVGTFQKNIIVGVGTSPYDFRRPDPKAFLANGVKRAGYDVITPSKPGTADDLFVLGINAPTDAQLNRAADSKHEYLRGRPEGL